MQNEKLEKSLSKLLAFGMAFTTIFLISGSVTDPVNVPKLVSLGVFGSSGFALLVFTDLRTRLFTEKKLLAASAFFLMAMISAVIFSKSPLSQNIYGSYGRNNGLLCYVFLGIILLCYSSLRSQKSFDLLVKALILSGFVNLAYGGWVIGFGDFVGWYNPYRGILGTFGNPNFIGAFLGMFFSVYIALAAGKQSSSKLRVSLVLVLPLTILEILKSNAIQGRVLAALGLGIVGFFVLRSYSNRFWTGVYSIFTLVVGSTALAGALQHGPLVDYIYKTSVSLRGQYWLAAWNTGSTNPVTGVGMDSFGDWYRRSRDIRAITLPGVNTTVNTAHNVWMDMFAFGGWPLFLAYLFLLTFPLIAIVKVMRRNKDYNPTFVALTVGWVCYQVQSLISINQIGLAIWGWALSGALVGYEIFTRNDSEFAGGKSKNIGSTSRLNADRQQVLGVMAIAGGAVIGLVVSLPPLTSDVKFRSSQIVRTLPALQETMDIALFNPASTNKYLINIQTLEASNLFDVSHRYALIAVEWNPESFELWKALYYVKNSTPQEKSTALQNMIRLDPLNPDVTSTQ